MVMKKEIIKFLEENKVELFEKLVELELVFIDEEDDDEDRLSVDDLMFEVGCYEKGNDLIKNKLQVLADKYQVGADVLSLAWLLKHPAQLIPVIGTNQVERIKAAVTSTSLSLELQDWFSLYEAALGNEVP